MWHLVLNNGLNQKNKNMAKKNLIGKFIIAFDTICEGWQCAKDENDKPDPTLFDSEAEAMVELFDDALSMVENKNDEDLSEANITREQLAEMKRVFKTGDAELMKNFLKSNPSCNYNDEFIVPAEEFVLGRKAIFTTEGLVITGKSL